MISSDPQLADHRAAWALALTLDQADQDFWTAEPGEPCS